MRTFLALPAAISCLLAGQLPAAEIPPQASPRPWPQESSDLPVDPAATFGTLPNGFRYIILPNAVPKDRVSLRLHVACGSLEERDDQRGLAHFLEHMVFNGSKHFKPGELVPKMQRLGIGFGADANADTSFVQTVYKFDLPDLTDDTLNFAFQALRDFADGATLDQPEIDRERGVILSEKAMVEGGGGRQKMEDFTELFPGSLILRRYPAGQEEVIKTAQRENLLDLYTRYYTPRRMTFVVVGDIDPKVMETRIKDAFDSMTNPDNPGGPPDLGELQIPSDVVSSVIVDEGVAHPTITFAMVKPVGEMADTKAFRTSSFPLAATDLLLGRRMAFMAAEDDSPFVSAGAGRSDNLLNYAQFGELIATAANDREFGALSTMEMEFHRALEYGFSDSEIAEAKASLLGEVEKATAARATYGSAAIAADILDGIASGRVLTSHQTDFEIAKAGITALTTRSCNEAFRNYWGGPGVHVIYRTKAGPFGMTLDQLKEQLTRIYKTSRDYPVEPRADDQAAATFGYTDFGPPGKVKSRKEIVDQGIVRLVLANGVHVNFKKTAFEPGAIQILTRVGSGKVGQPAGKVGLDLFAGDVWDSAGLRRHTNEELARMLPGHDVSVAVGIEEDAFTLTGKTTPAGLEQELQLICADLSDPGYLEGNDPDRLESILGKACKDMTAMSEESAHSGGDASAAMNEWIHPGDFRFSVADPATLQSYTLDDVRAWLPPELGHGYLEVGVAGDVDEKTLLPLLLKTFGALPARPENAPVDASPVRHLPQAPATKFLAFPSEAPQALVTVTWETSYWFRDVRSQRRLALLAEIFTNRLLDELRQKMSATYSPIARSGISIPAKYGMINAQCAAAAGDVQKVADAIVRIGGDLAAHGVTADELERVRQPALSRWDSHLHDNSFWVTLVLSRLQANPSRLERLRDEVSDTKAITVKELNSLAAAYLGEDKALKVIVTPAEKN